MDSALTSYNQTSLIYSYWYHCQAYKEERLDFAKDKPFKVTQIISSGDGT